jgi:hypothetical protein
MSKNHEPQGDRQAAYSRSVMLRGWNPGVSPRGAGADRVTRCSTNTFNYMTELNP